MTTLYTDNDPFCCAWLSDLVKAGHLPPADILCAPIESLSYEQLAPYKQVHHFAGIGGWPLALQIAGVAPSIPLWTASCPCQPFSCAGRQQGTSDKRHLWPFLREHIAKHRPPVVFGEQVASKAGREWLAGVRVEMEALGYEVGAADLCAASVSAPMVSQRLHWVADRIKGMAPPTGEPLGICGQPRVSLGTLNSRLVASDRYHEHWWSGPLQVGWNCCEGEVARSGRKYRAQWRLKPGLYMLAHGVPNRVGQLCGFGNAIVPPLAATFIQAALDAINERGAIV